MGRSKTCQRIVGTNKKRCPRTRYKANLCRKCFLTKEATKKQRPAAAKKLPLKQPAEVGKGSTKNVEYVQVKLEDLPQDLKKRVDELLKKCDDIFSAYTPPRRVGSRTRVGFSKEKSEVKDAIKLICKTLVEVLGSVDSFQESILQDMKQPLTCRECFIAAYPNAYTYMPPLHRDDILEGVYSVFFLLTDISEKSGSVRIYKGSQKCPRNMRHTGDADLCHFFQGKVPNPIMVKGKRGDVVAFDARLLHQSVYNSSKDFRNLLSLSLFDNKSSGIPRWYQYETN